MCKKVRWNLPGETFEQTVARKIAEIDVLEKYGYDLIEHVTSLHCCISGASEPDCKGINAAVVRLIRRRLAQWTPSNPSSERYDNAVKAMCEAVLIEYEGSWLKKWEDEP